MQLKNILYYGKINYSTYVMLNVFREIIGSFPVFDLMTTGYNPELLVNKFCKATYSSIFSSITLTTTLRNSESIYFLQRKKLQINPHEPDLTTHPEKAENFYAFAHFTYQYTEGCLVVYDLQGADVHNEFLLTDPVIHCIDLLRFGTTNLGKSGIQKCFLAKHKCNDICKKLKIKQ
ncbi:32997_t:CDS:2 [Racocetra persica]|uniref:32997_t:CDS:1 n=1 Tax=Racocetra persica TaxID=160502 RepID=A0ACA9KM23_9GLOM|nr:32997_t:CDS:2 [Racocetra persica]